MVRFEMQRVPVSSSQLTSIGYDPATLTLEVEFRKGGVYQYVGISAETHEQLMAAESIGTFFNTMIREGGFAYARVS
jgi:KTSC domain